jgi:choline dehydrogenase
MAAVTYGRNMLCKSIAILVASLSAIAHSKPTARQAASIDTYDYIVVGSGPGGSPLAVNLAKANYTVLLLEAGDDQSADITTNIISLGIPLPSNRWDFFVKHYDDQAATLRSNHLTWKRADGSLWVGNGSAAPADATPLGMYYPRGATLGGSSVINAGAVHLPSRSDWSLVADLTGDRSWK